MASFAIVDREKHGDNAILMIVEEQDVAETIVVELRRRDVKADLVAEGTGDAGPGGGSRWHTTSKSS
jgi:hypothetical protein